MRSLSRKTTVLIAPSGRPSRGMPAEIDLKWLLSRLGKEGITSILVEGGGEVNASFLLPGLAQRVAFFYAPKILAGRDARKGVAGDGLHSIPAMIKLTAVDYGRLGPDLLLTARLNH